MIQIFLAVGACLVFLIIGFAAYFLTNDRIDQNYIEKLCDQLDWGDDFVDGR